MGYGNISVGRIPDQIQTPPPNLKNPPEILKYHQNTYMDPGVLHLGVYVGRLKNRLARPSLPHRGPGTTFSAISRDRRQKIDIALRWLKVSIDGLKVWAGWGHLEGGGVDWGFVDS